MEVVSMSNYSLVELYEIISSLETNVLSIEDFCTSSMRLKYEPKLSLLYKDTATVIGYIMVGLNGNRAFVIDQKFCPSVNLSECLSIFLDFINKQKESFPKLELLKVIVSKDSPLSEHLESYNFVCQRLLNSYELNPSDLGWKVDDYTRLVKEKVSLAKMRKMRIKENAPLLVPSYYCEDEVVDQNGYYSVRDYQNGMGGGVFDCRERNYKTVVYSSIMQT